MRHVEWRCTMSQPGGALRWIDMRIRVITDHEGCESDHRRADIGVEVKSDRDQEIGTGDRPDTFQWVTSASG